MRRFPGPLNRLAGAPGPEFPVVATTYRLTEHYLSGPMSRFNSWLNELQPEMFVELSPELAAERGIVHGGWLTVKTARGRIEARAMVTRRMRPLVVDGRVIHQIGIPFHWGFAGQSRRGQRQRPDLPGCRAEHEHARGKVLRLPGRGRPTQRTQLAADGITRDLADSHAHSRHAGIRPAGGRVYPWALESSSCRSCRKPATRLIGPFAAILNRLTWPFRRGHVASAAAGYRVLHRYHGLHRLQGVRSRL